MVEGRREGGGGMGSVTRNVTLGKPGKESVSHARTHMHDASTTSSTTRTTLACSLGIRVGRVAGGLTPGEIANRKPRPPATWAARSGQYICQLSCPARTFVRIGISKKKFIAIQVNAFIVKYMHP